MNDWLQTILVLLLCMGIIETSLHILNILIKKESKGGGK